MMVLGGTVEPKFNLNGMDSDTCRALLLHRRNSQLSRCDLKWPDWVALTEGLHMSLSYPKAVTMLVVPEHLTGC
jgi:hypothetical protein